MLAHYKGGIEMKQVKVFALAKKDVVGAQDVRVGDTVRYVVERPAHHAESTSTGTMGEHVYLVQYETAVKEVKIEEVLRENFTHWYVSIDEESEARLAGRPRVDEHTLKVIRQEVAKGIEEEKERVEKEALEAKTAEAQERVIEAWRNYSGNRLFVVTNSELDGLINTLGIKGPSTIKKTISETLFKEDNKGYSFNKADCGWREGANVHIRALGANTQTFTATLNGEEGAYHATILIHINPDTLIGVVELEIGALCYPIENIEFNSDPIERLNEWRGEDE
ncbi:hypothetical protein [Brochothrix phage BtpYZU04]